MLGCYLLNQSLLRYLYWNNRETFSFTITPGILKVVGKTFTLEVELWQCGGQIAEILTMTIPSTIPALEIKSQFPLVSYNSF